MKALKNWFSRRGALPLTAYLLALAVWPVSYTHLSPLQESDFMSNVSKKKSSLPTVQQPAAQIGRAHV